MRDGDPRVPSPKGATGVAKSEAALEEDSASGDEGGALVHSSEGLLLQPWPVVACSGIGGSKDAREYLLPEQKRHRLAGWPAVPVPAESHHLELSPVTVQRPALRLKDGPWLPQRLCFKPRPCHGPPRWTHIFILNPKHPGSSHHPVISHIQTLNCSSSVAPPLNADSYSTPRYPQRCHDIGSC